MGTQEFTGAGDPGARGQKDRLARLYKDSVDQFDPEAALADLASSTLNGANAAEICCDRHASDESRVALRYCSSEGERREYNFADLKQESERFAKLLQERGVRKGDLVAGLLPRTPELVITILATWRLGAVYMPLFTAFGPKAIEYRLIESKAKAVVCTTAFRDKIASDVDVDVVVVGEGHEGDQAFYAEPENADPIEPASCSIDDPFIMMFTSGTTGNSKSVVIPIRAIASFKRYMLDAIDLQTGDRFWNLADPGWAYGLYYTVTGPLALGLATTFYDGGFTPEDTYRIINELGITNLAGSPTAYRLLMAAPAGTGDAIIGQLRVVSSAGEPLNPEIIRWFSDYLHVDVYDHYGQTELGMVLCNHHGLEHPVHIGSAGYSSLGFRVVIVSPEGVELGVGEPGALAVDRDRSPFMWFQGYGNQPTKAFLGNYYLTGDTGELNDDGSISFIGRSDDVITTSGYRVGPFDVESALIEHESVVESAVVGKPDPKRTEIIKAFVVLKPGVEGTEALKQELALHVKQRLSSHAYPREIEFVTSLPKTPSGKVQRHILRAQEKANAG